MNCYELRAQGSLDPSQRQEPVLAGVLRRKQHIEDSDEMYWLYTAWQLIHR